jgi:hypothetical protein
MQRYGMALYTMIDTILHANKVLACLFHETNSHNLISTTSITAQAQTTKL